MEPEYSFHCGSCRRLSRSSRTRDLHCAQAGHPLPGIMCDTCPHVFETDTDRWRHMAAHNHFIFPCDLCQLTWPSRRELWQHQLDDHALWSCPGCGCAIPTPDDALYSVHAHLEDVHGFPCRWCETVWASNDALHRHEERRHRHCHVCGRHFKSANKLERHKRRARHRYRPVKCPFCLYCGESAAGVVHHIERGTCPSLIRVDRFFFWMMRRQNPRARLSGLVLAFDPKRLIAKHGPSKGGGWRCRFCSRKYRTKSMLRLHLALVCPSCESQCMWWDWRLTRQIRPTLTVVRMTTAAGCSAPLQRLCTTWRLGSVGTRDVGGRSA